MASCNAINDIMFVSVISEARDCLECWARDVVAGCWGCQKTPREMRPREGYKGGSLAA